VKKVKIFSPGTKNRARLQGFAEKDLNFKKFWNSQQIGLSPEQQETLQTV
jgi:hypothetical protein